MKQGNQKMTRTDHGKTHIYSRHINWNQSDARA